MTDRGEAPSPARPRRISAAEAVAVAVSLAWLGLNAWAVLAAGPHLREPGWTDPMAPARAVLGVLLPVALLWVAIASTRAARALRAESARLRAILAAAHETQTERQRAASEALRRAVEERIAEIDRAQADLRADVAALRAVPRNPARAEGPLPPDAFIRAFDLPRDARDEEGFRVLRAALDHPATAPLVSATQDLLTLLAQDGIRMDDFGVAPADAVLWRALAEGTRGAAVAALGDVRDRSSLALARGRMRDDAVFRDTARHFLQTFAQVFADFAAQATDDDLRRFGDTRTARAFRLAAAAAGFFD